MNETIHLEPTLHEIALAMRRHFINSHAIKPIPQIWINSGKVSNTQYLASLAESPMPMNDKFYPGVRFTLMQASSEIQRYKFEREKLHYLVSALNKYLYEVIPKLLVRFPFIKTELGILPRSDRVVQPFGLRLDCIPNNEDGDLVIVDENEGSAGVSIIVCLSEVLESYGFGQVFDKTAFEKNIIDFVDRLKLNKKTECVLILSPESIHSKSTSRAKEVELLCQAICLSGVGYLTMTSDELLEQQNSLYFDDDSLFINGKKMALIFNLLEPNGFLAENHELISKISKKISSLQGKSTNVVDKARKQVTKSDLAILRLPAVKEYISSHSLLSRDEIDLLEKYCVMRSVIVFSRRKSQIDILRVRNISDKGLETEVVFSGNRDDLDIDAFTGQVFKPVDGSGARGVLIVDSVNGATAKAKIKNSFLGELERLRSPTIMVCEQLVESEKWNTNLPSSLLRGEKKFGYGNVRLEVSHCYDPVSRASAILSLTVSIDTTGSKKVHGGSATVLCPLKLI